MTKSQPSRENTITSAPYLSILLETNFQPSPCSSATIRSADWLASVSGTNTIPYRSPTRRDRSREGSRPPGSVGTVGLNGSDGLSAPATSEPRQWRRILHPSTDAKIRPQCPLGLSEGLVGGLRRMYLAVVFVRAFRVRVRRVTVEDSESPISHFIAIGRGKTQPSRPCRQHRSAQDRV
jgi:hypothetical protein